VNDLPFVIPAPGRHQVGGAPDGADALLIARLAAIAPGGVLHVTQDDLRMARTVEMLGFMAPDLTVISFPAWDCLPYDRASPHRDILARRIDALSRLSAMEEGARAKLVVVTTVAAILQRVPTPAGFKGATLELKRGGRLDQAKLVEYLVGKGYARSGTVGEAGEFAVRGGIVDLFPPGTTMPIRVDFFGDEVEDLRLFDPLSQRSLGKLDDFTLRPINELQLTREAVEHFRTNYRSEFGT
jgi:transcription-repair coupling factor (superfamily II helicase)